MDRLDGSPAPHRKPQRLSKRLIPYLGYGISLASLIWAFHRFPFRELIQHLRTLDWWWLALAVGLEVGAFLVDAWRWRELLRPAHAPSFGASAQAVFAGLFINDVLPARAGEVVRCFLLSYKSDIHLPLVITSYVILRVMDGLCVVVLYFATVFTVERAGAVTGVMSAYAGVAIFLALVLFWVLFRKQHAHHFVSNRSWAARFLHFLDEVHRLGNARELRIVLGASAAYWILQVCAVWAIARSDRFFYDFGQMAFLLVVKNVGTMVPTAPAAVGAFQATTIYALGRMYTEATDAKILAELMFGFLTLPGLVGGAIAVAKAGLDLKELVQHAQEAHSRHHPGEPTA